MSHDRLPPLTELMYPTTASRKAMKRIVAHPGVLITHPYRWSRIVAMLPPFARKAVLANLSPVLDLNDLVDDLLPPGQPTAMRMLDTTELAEDVAAAVRVAWPVVVPTTSIMQMTDDGP